MQKFKAIITGSSVQFNFNGKMYTARKSHPNYSRVVKAVKVKDGQTAASLVQIDKAVEILTKGFVSFSKEGHVFYKGIQVHGSLAERIFKLIRAKKDFTPFVAFLERVQNNPSPESIQDLFTFLQYMELPLTNRGTFIAYKSVRENFRDCHTGKLDYSIGKVVKMPRTKVCQARETGCSTGLHVGSWEYASSFGGALTLAVEVDPANVVSVPMDCSHQKCRVCEFKAWRQVREPIKGAIVSIKDCTPSVGPLRISKLGSATVAQRLLKAGYTNIATLSVRLKGVAEGFPITKEDRKALLAMYTNHLQDKPQNDIEE